MSWELVNLLDVPADGPAVPRWAGLVYPGGRHLWSGEPEAGKSLAADIVLLEALRANGGAILVDLEMGASARRARLVDLGATDQELAAIVYVEPDSPPTATDIELLLAEVGAIPADTVAVIDAAATAYSISGLDDHARKDVELFAIRWIVPLYMAGVATILVDHVAKAREGRGKYAFGSERKVGSVDVHLGFEAVSPLRRGGTGLVRIATHKDRVGRLERPYAAELELSSDPDTHRMSWSWRAPAGKTTDGDEWYPTRLMEKVSRYLETSPGGANRAAIYRDVQGKRGWLVKAVDGLLSTGFAAEMVPGAKGTEIRSIVPYREEPSTTTDGAIPQDSSRSTGNRSHGSQPFPTVPGTVPAEPFPPFPPPTGGNGNGNHHGNDHDEAEPERLLTLPGAGS